MALFSIALLIVNAAPLVAQGQSELNHGNDFDKKPDGKGAVPRGNAPPWARPGNNGISYHNGPLILGTTNVYYIWYGNWSGNSATTILTDLAQAIGGSPYFNINTTYTNGSGGRVSKSVSLAG